jgi:hypothetical protein
MKTCANCGSVYVNFPWKHGDKECCSKVCRDTLKRKDETIVFSAPKRMDLRKHLLHQDDPDDACRCIGCRRTN